MTKKIIRFCYRKLIDASSVKQWDKYVFESTYAEFLMQAQFYNQEKKYSGFSELIQFAPGAEKLHYLVSAAITGYLQQLDGTIPDITDTLGRQFLAFSNYRFEIINSDIKNRSNHQVAINFFSDSLVWHDTIENHLLVSPLTEQNSDDGVITHLMRLQPFLSIYSLKISEE